MSHGTRGEYQRGCRCNPCAVANNIYAAKARNSRRTITPNGWKIPASAKNQHGVGVDTTTVNIAATWRENAVCRMFDPAMWDIDNPGDWATAAQICAKCPVQQQCLTDHLGNIDAFGLYGGLPLWAGQPLEKKTA